MAHYYDRFGLTTGITAPLIGPASMGRYKMHAGMGVVGVDDAAAVSGLAAVASNDDVTKFMKDAMSTITGGLFDDFSSSMDAEKVFPKVAAFYNTMAWEIVALLGYSKANQEGHRIYFRLGELAAKLNPKVVRFGYSYAAPGNNRVNSDEGSDFRTSSGGGGTAIGIEHRWEASATEEFFTGSLATGRAGRRLEVEWSVCETLYRIKISLASLASEARRRSVFAGMLVKYVGGGGEKTLLGMSFLGSPAEVPSDIVKVLASDYTAESRSTSIGVKPGVKTKTVGVGTGAGIGTGTAPSGDSSGPLIAGIAAIAGIYLLSKS